MNYPYISVYAPNETDFSHNGLRILTPTIVEITDALNNEYSFTISHPLDDFGSWQYIRENYIINAQGQLFRINRKTLSMANDGSYEIKADGMHISYDLNYYFIKDVRPTLKTGAVALDIIVNSTYTNRGSSTAEQPTSRFNFYTDINPATPTADDLKTAYYEHMSVTKALIGADNCFISTWGGEIVRDNFNVQILKRRGQDNAFSIRYGVDMMEIQQEIDYSSYCSSIYYEATVFNEYINGEGTRTRTETIFTGTASLNTLDMEAFPIPPMQYYSFGLNYKDIKSVGATPTNAEIRVACEDLARKYMLMNCQPSINYRVNFADLKNYDMYKDFIGLQECNVGDTGTIYHELLGISTTQQIVKKTINGITGETISIELGNLRKSLTSELAKTR